MSSDSDSDDYYGPALPPGFKQGAPPVSSSGDKKPDTTKKSEDLQIGPIIPPSLRAKLEASVSSSSGVEDGRIGAKSGDDASNLTNTNTVEGSDSDSDADIIGPLPPDHPKAQQPVVGSSVPSSSDEKKMKREEWMLVPPKNKIIPGLGLGPRKFLTRTPQDSRNSDEEDDEEALAREADAEIEKKLIDEYDQKMEDLKKDYEVKKRRGESLMEIHQKDMKKKKGETDNQKAERKPFDRDTDLQVSGLSSADKQKYIEKSKELNTKFSRGSRKYL